jgi:hypothetical protein
MKICKQNSFITFFLQNINPGQKNLRLSGYICWYGKGEQKKAARRAKKS